MRSTIENLISQAPDRLLSREEERELTKRAASGDRDARKKLVIYNHRLVISVANDYKDMGVAFEDLLMAGFEGLLKGIDKFDPVLGNKLSTYVTWWIRQAVLRELDQQSTTIRIPGYVRSLNRKVNRLEEKREVQLSPADIQEEFGVSKEVAQAVKRAGPTASLDSSFSRSNEGSLKEVVENRKAE
ncbi:MAG: sigma-70 family RNA polymerase sigma factor, partial [Candidatus Bipolaricaulia bacterium]